MLTLIILHTQRRLLVLVLILDTSINDTNIHIGMNINMHIRTSINSNTNSDILILVPLLILSIIRRVIRRLVSTIVLLPMFILILGICPFPIAPLLKQFLAKR